MYEYAARVIKVVDGDTVDVDIDLGLDVHRKERLRILGVDAPEVSAPGPEGENARDWLRKYLLPGDTVIIRTVKDRKEKYGRYLASIQAAPAAWEGALPIDISAEMIKAGYARPYDGGKR
jgi:micrococcal nuclease